VGIAHLGVQLRHVLERVDCRFHKERHEAELYAVLLFVLFAMLGPQGYDFGHIDFVECGQQGGGMLRFDQALGNPAANGAHHHEFLFPRIAGGGKIDFRLAAGQIGGDNFAAQLRRSRIGSWRHLMDRLR